MSGGSAFRKTTQIFLPAAAQTTPAGQYNPYPAHLLGPGKIAAGFDALAALLPAAGNVLVAGFPGVLSNIERCFANMYFERQEFASHQIVIAAGSDWQVVHVPTHANHFYDGHRFEFNSSIEAETGSSCHVMSRVEGTQMLLEIENGALVSFNYAKKFRHSGPLRSRPADQPERRTSEGGQDFCQTQITVGRRGSAR